MAIARTTTAFLILIALASLAAAASNKQSAPAGSLKSAPPEYAHFTVAEFERGFLALAFGSDLRIGARPRGIRRFDRPILAHVIAGGSVARTEAMNRIVEEYTGKVPNLHLSLTPDRQNADIEIRLIDEKDFKAALRAAFGVKVARDFVRRTNPQCMTSVKSDEGGAIVRSVSFIIVDKGEEVFRDCAYHELLHAFGLSNHDQHNRWTTLNQKRTVGYLTVYDRGLLTLLYDPAITPGMTRAAVRAVLPGVIGGLGLAAPRRRR
jgi:hypothetical protein